LVLDERTVDDGSEVLGKGRRKGLSTIAGIFVLSVMIIAIISAALIAYNSGFVTSQNAAALQNDAIQNQINSIKSQINSVQSNEWNLPVTNQTPTTRQETIEWTNFVSGQDRFYPSTILVNQGDNVSITFISNDTDAHTLTIGPPYDFQINATVPGTQDYLLNEKSFTTPATNNSPGVKVYGTPGNITTTGSFVAKYAGIYEFFCVYHVQIGMFGYLVVLPNSAYQNHTTAFSTGGSSSSSSSGVTVNIVNGAYNQNQSENFVPDTIVVVIGVNNTVTWVNNDIATHTVTSDAAGLFNSGYLNAGQSWSYTFTAPGTYAYHCSIHPWMTGTVIVESESA
jgi:plastocyanin